MWTVSLEEFNEGYTHENWLYKNIYTNYSRIYYIIDGQGFCRFQGRTFLLKKNHLYFFPARTYFDLFENIEDKLLHTYVHIITHPAVTHFVEVKVKQGSPLADAVALWRKYAHSSDYQLISDIVQLVLSRINEQYSATNAVADQVKEYIDSTGYAPFNMSMLSKALGYSREYVTRIFHSAYQITPVQYYNAKRMKLALEMLLDGETVTAIAERFNFSSPYAFSKAFKSYFGSSPLRYASELSSNAITDRKRKV
jgi:AraC-like DNA-binding protein